LIEQKQAVVVFSLEAQSMIYLSFHGFNRNVDKH